MVSLGLKETMLAFFNHQITKVKRHEVQNEHICRVESILLSVNIIDTLGSGTFISEKHERTKESQWFNI